MSLFASLGQGDIWALSGISFASAISDILDRDEFCLEELLEEDELIQEVKSKNEALLDFLCQESTLEKLINFIVLPGIDTDSASRRYKYPYMSCEVICCEIPEILTRLAEHCDGKHLENLFALLTRDSALDHYLSGYFEKILEMLFRCMTVPLMQYINKAGPPLMLNFLKHMDNYSVMQIVQRLMLPHIPFSNQGDIDPAAQSNAELHQCYWSYNRDCCYLLLESLFDYGNADVPLHISDLLITVLQLSPPETLIIKCLCETNFVTRMLRCCVTENGDTCSAAVAMSSTASVSLACMAVLESLVSRLFESALPPFDPIQDGNDGSCSAAERDLDCEHLAAVKANIDDICGLFCQFLPSINGVLRRYIDNNPSAPLLSQSKISVPRLGQRGLQLIKLVEAVVRLASPQVDGAMCEVGLFQTCLDLFFHFRNHSLLHLSVQRIVITVIESDRSRSAAQWHILNKCNLIDVVIGTVGAYSVSGQQLLLSKDSSAAESSSLTTMSAEETHSSLMGSSIILAQALSLLLEVDVHTLVDTELLSDMLDREFSAADAIPAASDSISEKNFSDGEPAAVTDNDNATENHELVYLTKQETTSGIEDSSDYERHNVLNDDPSHHIRLSLRSEVEHDVLCRWDQFVDEKLKVVLEHQIGNVTGSSGPFSLAGPFGMGAFPMMGQQQDESLKLGVDLDLYRMGHGRDEDDEDDDDEDHQVHADDSEFAHFGHDHHHQHHPHSQQQTNQEQTRSEFDLWGDYFEDEPSSVSSDAVAPDGPRDGWAASETSVAEEKLSDAVEQSPPVNRDSFDFSGFADFNSFQFPSLSEVPEIQSPKAEVDDGLREESLKVEFADFADFSE